MYTPVKQKYSRRLMTTAYTEHKNSRTQIYKPEKLNQSLQESQPMTNINQRLNFQKLQQSRLYYMKSKPSTRANASKVTADYRKTTLDYLNSKFQQAYSREKERKQLLKKTTKAEKINNSMHTIDYQQIKVIFNSYMDAIRELRVKSISEYFLALILKQTNFINSILYERDVVSLLWRELNQPNIGELFIFICVLYFHLKNNLGQSNKSNLITYVLRLFQELGFKFSFQTLEKSYKRGLEVLEDRTVKLSLLNNRQNRPTASSLSRHKSKK